jgi:hypothetical protein
MNRSAVSADLAAVLFTRAGGSALLDVWAID